ncbi:OLC1v1022277C2 [Oldenlandia corymbosa var. corymbosa]|uniref:Protein Iojap, chloroplastic n=1 Tax=Oldenlandia corymbosa var. corymbosa TaxID=529605 RepID=A0AAV1BZV5_OLDCO|nr:OLC1v1022277C2 [Oldenlandia corymbosa var. corymbosa]
MEIINFSSVLLHNRLSCPAVQLHLRRHRFGRPRPPAQKQQPQQHHLLSTTTSLNYPNSSFTFPGLRRHPSALGSNTSMDTDDMYDDLFKKYGKVVFTRNDQKPAIQEIEDDAESLSFAVAAAKVASEVKAGDIKVLFVKPLVYWTRFFIIATAFSRPQIDAIGTKIRDMAEKQFGKVAAGDSKPNSWTLLDFGECFFMIL